MIDFDCKYILNVPDHMKDACWTGYILDLYTVPAGGYARLIFVYPDNGVFDERLLLKAEADRYTRVSLMNLDCSFCSRRLHSVKENARLLYNAGVSIDAASGIAAAIRLVSKLLDCHDYEKYENIADFFCISISADDVFEMYKSHGASAELPF